MKMHRHQAAAALAGVILVAAGGSAGCTSAFDSAQPPAHLASQGTDVAIGEADDGIHALTQRVNWAQMEIAPVVQGF